MKCWRRKAGRGFTRAEGYTEKELLRFAHDHLASAQILFERSPTCYDSAGFLSHLGVELILKAHLLRATDQFPKSHRLQRLQQLVEQAIPGFEVTSDGARIVALLDGFHPLRYPSPRGSAVIGSRDRAPIDALVRALVDGFPNDIQAFFTNSPEKGGRMLVEYPPRTKE